jgi:hypothetical protein
MTAAAFCAPFAERNRSLRLRKQIVVGRAAETKILE